MYIHILAQTLYCTCILIKNFMNDTVPDFTSNGINQFLPEYFAKRYFSTRVRLTGN